MDTTNKEAAEEVALIERFRQDMHEGWAYWAEHWQRSREAEKASGESAQASREIDQAVEQARRDDPRAWHSILLGRDSDLNNLPPLFGPCQGTMSNDDVMSMAAEQVEQESNVSEAYFKALRDALEGGFGWLWVRNPPVGGKSQAPSIAIEHVKDRYAVLFDPRTAPSMDPDDALWAAVSSRWPKAKFKAKYPHVQLSQGDWMKDLPSDFRDWWSDEETVRVTEYYYKKNKTDMANWVRVTDTEILEDPCEYGPAVPIVLVSGLKKDMG